MTSRRWMGRFGVACSTIAYGGKCIMREGNCGGETHTSRRSSQSMPRLWDCVALPFLILSQFATTHKAHYSRRDLRGLRGL